MKRLSLLPRIGVVVDFGGHQLSFRHAPVLETLVNLRGRGFSVQNFVTVAFEQLREIELPELGNFSLAPKKKVTTRRKSKARG